MKKPRAKAAIIIVAFQASPYLPFVDIIQGGFMNMTPHRIDVHNHIVPAEYLRELAKIGIVNSLGRDFPEWSAEKTFAVMEANGIRTAVTSISSPGVYFGKADFAKKVARICNDISARLISDNPARFGAFATLPLPDVKDSLAELLYAMDTLLLDGVVVLSNYKGLYIGDYSLDELYQELNRRKAVVYVHPTDPVAGNPLGKEIPTFLMEVTFETARVIFNLLYRGVFERYPDIRWIFAHAGGALPYLTWRISLGQFILPDGGKTVPRGVPFYLKRLYYDTGLSANPYVFRALSELVEPSQILFGTDYPFAPDIISAETVRGLRAYNGFSAEELEKIEYGNALNLFPRLARLYAAG
jgi:6-methylsalicylate decarboxylase